MRGRGKAKRLDRKRKIGADAAAPKKKKRRKVQNEDLVPKTDASKAAGGRNYQKKGLKSNLPSKTKVRCWKCGVTIRKGQ